MLVDPILPMPPFVLLIAEDNPDDRLLLEHVWTGKPDVQLFFVEDGEELMDFILHQGQYAQMEFVPRPSLILLDLRMPRKNGFEVLEELKTHPDWKAIPIVVTTTSDLAPDISRAYQLGANSYLCKPQTIQEILGFVETLNHYWFSTVCLPI